MTQSILILGGYGKTGRKVVELLLPFSNVSVVIAGRNPDRASNRANSLQRQYNPHRIQQMCGTSRNSYTHVKELIL